ncbi:NUDIX domain-containing protein [Paeniglutamicibacter kerguelensis]|uniref:8-oxo-dGTP pyrophosphatase MutT (NUDIX family) n=1 Tax=Paeniglutamicibacter kerguelensis TaxID=254788 RepID=A0ABS4XDA0_9MICC|nr:NUDIX hydrolase [Paeniglutamicibacter kerguelensis]MBP2386447.1 8-oxo-dGTP pyrophosphatase MutT (NUDIX family) [Paeniglutamicibacter kerguelensis]
MPAAIDKAVCYVVQDGHLLVFTHLRHPMHVTGVQVPAGTIKAGESPSRAALRELHEETGLEGSVVRSLGTADYEITTRHFFELEVPSRDISLRWIAGEPEPAHGGAPETWECWWLPLEQAHVLAAGLGRLFGTH